MGLMNARRKAVVVALCSLILLPLRAPAQTTRPGPPVTGLASTRPVLAGASTRSAATQPTDQFMMNFKDAPLDVVLDYLSSKGGFTILKEGPVDGRVNILSKYPVSRQEAVVLLDAELKANNFAAVRQGNTLKIMPRDKAMKSNIPVRYGADPKDIPATDELVTQVMPVRNVDAAKLKEDLKPLISSTDVAANEGSNAIVITDTSANIRRIAEIIYNLDQQDQASSGLRVVTLKYANATNAAKMIDTLFKQDGDGNPRSGPQMMGPQQGPPQPAAGAAGGKRSRGKVITAADDRTNTIVVTGPADALKTIDDLLTRLDSNPVPASVIKTFPLKYADAEAVSKLIMSIFQPKEQNDNPFRFFIFGGGNNDQAASKVKVTATFDERTNTLIVTGPAATMSEIEALVNKLDANPVAASSIHIFALKYADSYSAAKLINSIFNPSTTETGRSLERVYIFDEGAQPAPAKAAKVNATSDDRTNSVIVTAPVESMKIIEEIVHEMDARPGSEDTILIVHLRNAQAQNLELVLNTLFGNEQNNNGQNQQNQNGNNPNQPNQNGQSQFANGNLPGGSSNARSGFNSQNNQNRNNRGNNKNGNNRSNLNTANAYSELTGQVLVVADPDTNTLLVTTAVKYREEVKQIIHELDRPVAQVLIKVLVAEVTHDSSADFGTDFSVLNTRANGNGQSFGGTFGNPGSGLVVNFLENNLNAQLHALAEQDKLDVLSRPYILASDNQPAEILVGQEVPIVTSNYTTALGQTVANYDYQKVGIIVDVTPHINPDGQVIMDIAPEISALTGQTVSVGVGISPPVISDRSAFSRVGIRDGQTIVIGGLMQDQKTLTRTKIPILSDIPLLGYVFGRTQVGSTKTELLIFLTPHVALMPDVLDPMSTDELQGTKLTPNAVSPGQFQEHMKGMQRGNVPTTQRVTPAPEVFEPKATTQPDENR